MKGLFLFFVFCFGYYSGNPGHPGPKGPDINNVKEMLLKSFPMKWPYLDICLYIFQIQDHSVELCKEAILKETDQSKLIALYALIYYNKKEL